MKPQGKCFAIALMVFVASVGHAQAPQTQRDPDNPDFKAQIWGDVGTEFITRVDSYVELRSELEKGLPPLTVTDKPAEIRRAERALARRIRAARKKAKPGDKFSSPPQNGRPRIDRQRRADKSVAAWRYQC